MITYRQATLDDVDGMAEVEAASWPRSLAASRKAIADRVSVFAAAQWVAVLDGRIIGAAFAQRICLQQLQTTPLTYEYVTDHGTFRKTHLSDGPIYQLVGVGVAPAGQGMGCGRALIDRQIEFARGIDGITRILGFTRPVRFHQFPQLSIEEYLKRRSESGHVADPVLSFHLDSGARLVSSHADFRPNDHESRGYGILIEYPA
ncbi:MAG: GNAT family N-acetyltransferase [Fuerstiella sp.]|nr:GNAT family N-acetyltransferase [Fuerstiella sp.]MCP4857217.1 GNAT family N-acetyltransferase [Fuerstiella sp.]